MLDVEMLEQLTQVFEGLDKEVTLVTHDSPHENQDELLALIKDL